MGHVTEPPEPTAEDLYAEIYSVICDAVERAWQGLPVERGVDEANVMHTSGYARAAATRVMDAISEIRAPETRLDDEIHGAEEEHFDRLWYYRTLTNPNRTAEDLAVAEAHLREIEAKHKNLITEGDFELGVIHGKLSALRWVLGEEWDALDT